MTEEIKKYRRRADSVIFEGIQYTQGTQPGAIASFVLNVDVDSRVTIQNERMLDVVRPLFTEWDMDRGYLPLQVLDPVSKLPFRLNINDWIVRSVQKIPSPKGYISATPGRDDLSAALLFVKPDVFHRDYAELSKHEEEEIRAGLKDLVFEGMKVNIETAEYRHHDLAEGIVDVIIAAGWTRKGPA